MNKVYCDRCKRDLGNLKTYEVVNLQINDLKEYATNNDKGIDYRKTLCPECAIDLMNIIDIECDRYKLITKVEDRGRKMRDLEWNSFDKYPHYVYATAFLANGELADYKIQNRERDWGDRTFRGSTWENEVWQHGFIDKDWNLTCEYNKILVNNDDEHNEAFEKLEDWLFDNFKIYKKANLVRLYRKENKDE